MKKLNKKGFTLIELMIVLAIIAILAVVLVPKAASLKNSAKSTGVLSNITSVRGFLESKSTMNATALQASMATVFTADNALPNPFYKNTGISLWSNGANFGITPTVYDASTYDSVIILNGTGNVPTSPALPWTVATVPSIANKGMIVIYVYTDGYILYGIDDTGLPINQAIIK